MESIKKRVSFVISKLLLAVILVVGILLVNSAFAADYEFGGSYPEVDYSFGGSYADDSYSFGGSYPDTSYSFGGSYPEVDYSFGGSYADDSYSFGGSYPDTSYSFGGSYPDSSYSFGGSYPDTSYSFGGSYPDTSYSFGGSYPEVDYSFGGSYADDSYSFGGSYPDTSYSFGGSYPDSSYSFGGSYPDTSYSFGGSYPDTSYSYTPQQQLQQLIQQQRYPQTSYSTPSYSQPRYSTPSYSQPSYRPSTPSYSTPAYPQPRPTPTPSYPTPSYPTPQPPRYYPTPTPTPVPQPLPVCTVSIYPVNTTVVKGSAVTVGWASSNAVYVTISGGTYNNTRLNNSGSFTIYPTVNTTYTVRCYSASGQTNMATAYISVTQPSIPTPCLTCLNPITPTYYPPTYNPPTYNPPTYNPPTYYPPTPCVNCSTPYPQTPIVNTKYCLNVATTGAVPQKSTAVIYGYLAPCNEVTTVWFDYGTSYNNLWWRTTRENTTYTGTFSANMSGLACGTTYYYRAVAQNTYETKYGEILSFKTSPCAKLNYNYNYNYSYGGTKTSTPVYTKGNVPLPEIDATKKVEKETTTKGNCLCESDYMRLDIENLETAVVPGKLANFKVTYKNIGTEKLDKVIVRVVLPEELTVYSSDNGQYTKGGKSLLIAMPSLSKNMGGTFVITANVNSSVETGKQIFVNAYANYTVPTVLKDGEAMKGEVSAYTLSLSSNNSQSITSGTSGVNKNTTTSTTSSSWFPTNAFEWILAVVALIAFLIVLRFIVNAFRTPNA